MEGLDGGFFFWGLGGGGGWYLLPFFAFAVWVEDYGVLGLGGIGMVCGFYEVVSELLGYIYIKIVGGICVS